MDKRELKNGIELKPGIPEFFFCPFKNLLTISRIFVSPNYIHTDFKIICLISTFQILEFKHHLKEKKIKTKHEKLTIFKFTFLERNEFEKYQQLPSTGTIIS